MTRTKSTFLALLAILLTPMTANADLIRLEATSLNVNVSGFSVLFDDTGDGLLDWDEIVNYSGITFSPFISHFYDELILVPSIVGVSNYSFDPSIGSFEFDFCTTDPLGWCSVSPSNIIRAFNDTFSYSLTRVPEPGTLALLAIGLLGMATARRRRKI